MNVNVSKVIFQRMMNVKKRKKLRMIVIKVAKHVTVLKEKIVLIARNIGKKMMKINVFAQMNIQKTL